MDGQVGQPCQLAPARLAPRDVGGSQETGDDFKGHRTLITEGGFFSAHRVLCFQGSGVLQTLCKVYHSRCLHGVGDDTSLLSVCSVLSWRQLEATSTHQQC